MPDDNSNNLTFNFQLALDNKYIPLYVTFKKSLGHFPTKMAKLITTHTLVETQEKRRSLRQNKHQLIA